MTVCNVYLAAEKVFDINAYHQRYIGLEILYVGWQYMGSTYQPKEENTVEVTSAAFTRKHSAYMIEVGACVQ